MPEKKTHKTVKGLKMIPINLDYNLKKGTPVWLHMAVKPPSRSLN